MRETTVTLHDGTTRVILESGYISTDFPHVRSFGYDTVDGIPIWYDRRWDVGKEGIFDYTFILPMHLQKDSLFMHYIINDKIVYNYCKQERWQLATEQFMDLLNVSEDVKNEYPGMQISFEMFTEGLVDHLDFGY